MDIQINTIYLIDAKDLGSKQCRCEIETTGMLPDEPVIQEKEGRVTRGKPQNRLGLGFANHFDETAALDDLESMLCNLI